MKESFPKKAETAPVVAPIIKESVVETSKEGSLERNDLSKIEFFITDHGMRHPDSVSSERMSEIYSEMKKQGIESIRFDCDWEEICPEPGKANQHILDTYVQEMLSMEEKGLLPPTVVLSSPPEWATKLIKENRKEEYFQAYEQYVNTIAEAFSKAGVEVNQAQLFNEINHPAIYNFFGDLENFPKIAEMARTAFKKNGLDIKLSTSFIVGNLAEKTSALMHKPNLETFLNEFEKIKDSIDVISLDYYPGMWHLPVETVQKPGDAFPIQTSLNPIKALGNNINRTFKNIDMLKTTCERISTWGKEYEFGEAGFPTNEPYSNGRRQRLQYDMYFRALRQMFVDFDARGIQLPKRIGIYETQDEDNRLGAEVDANPIAKWIKKRKIFPESHFGLYTKEEQKKEILQGNLKGAPSENEESQLKKLIDYIHQPIDR